MFLSLEKAGEKLLNWIESNVPDPGRHGFGKIAEGRRIRQARSIEKKARVLLDNVDPPVKRDDGS